MYYLMICYRSVKIENKFSGQNFFQKPNHRICFSILISSQNRKTNSLVQFLEEVLARKFAFEIYWPLVNWRIKARTSKANDIQAKIQMLIISCRIKNYIVFKICRTLVLRLVEILIKCLILVKFMRFPPIFPGLIMIFFIIPNCTELHFLKSSWIKTHEKPSQL